MIGQGTVLASPMAMATVVASVVKGSAVLPRLLPDHEAEARGSRPSRSPRAEARQLRTMMRAVVERGSGSVLGDLPGGPVIAKTGTAEFGDKPPLPTHAWMIAGARRPRRRGLRREGRLRLADRRADPRAVPPRGPMTDQPSSGPTPADEGVRTFRPVDPASRPLRRRRTARVLVVDEDGRMLLFSDSDPGVPGRQWWITPGGGVEPGESDLEAAVRELSEETGLVVDERALVGPIARRHVLHGYSDVVVDQDEVFFAVTVPPFEIDTAGHTEEERLTMTSHRWWTRAELAATQEEVWPVALLALWDLVDADAAELDLGMQEESTVPVEAT